jgi:hypothetical protein
MNHFLNGDCDMLRKNGLKAGFLILTAAGLAGAHLGETSLSIKGGETFAPNQSVAIKWNVSVLHEGSDIDLSVNGGTSWTTLKEDFKETSGMNTYNWTVTSAATQTAKIRICQHQSTTTAGCRSQDVTNAPSNPINGNYILVSPAFTISAPSGLGQASDPQGAFALDFIPATRNVNVSFALAERGPVLLQAFDTRGRLLATLVESDFAAGSHKLSLFSNRLETSGALLFKLKAGAQVQSYNWTP